MKSRQNPNLIHKDLTNQAANNRTSTKGTDGTSLAVVAIILGMILLFIAVTGNWQLGVGGIGLGLTMLGVLGLVGYAKR